MRAELQVTGVSNDASRTVRMELKGESVTSGVFQYGVATKGTVKVWGSADLIGLDAPSSASILSTSADVIAIEVGGSANITGDLYVVGVDSIKLKGGGLTVGGTSDRDEILAEHCHFSVDPPEWPEINTAQFKALCTTTVSDAKALKSATELTNVVIAAGTNPTITSDVTINGVLYIEAPNQVKFAAHSTVKGLIVTEERRDLPISGNTITFRGNTAFPGTDALPDTPEFAAIKQHRGTVLLAPSFYADFSGNMHMLNGVLAADKLSFTGSTDIEGNMMGCVLGLTTEHMSFTGSARLEFNRPVDDDPPAGFVHPFQFVPIPGSYSEVNQ